MSVVMMGLAGGAYAALPVLDADSGMDVSNTPMEASREFSGRPFMEMQNKAREINLDLVVNSAPAATLKLSAPTKRKKLGSAVKSLPMEMQGLDSEVQNAQEQMFKALDLGMTMTITGIGVVFGGLAFGVPGAVMGGAFAYGVWTVAKKTV